MNERKIVWKHLIFSDLDLILNDHLQMKIVGLTIDIMLRRNQRNFLKEGLESEEKMFSASKNSSGSFDELVESD